MNDLDREGHRKMEKFKAQTNTRELKKKNFSLPYIPIAIRMHISEFSTMYQSPTISVSAWLGKDISLQFVVLLLTSSDPSTFYWISQTRSVINKHLTRMHSSRMRTARLLPVSPSMHCSQGVYLVWRGVPGLGGLPGLGGVPGPGGCTGSLGYPWSWGVCTWSGGGCTWSWGGGGYLVQGWVPGPEGVYLVLGWGGVPAQVSPPWTEWQTLVKT